MKRRSIRPFTVLPLALLSVVATTGAVLGDPCVDPGERSAICAVEISISRAGQRLTSLDPGRALPLTAGEKVRLQFDAFDQNRRRFPLERTAYGHDLGDCRDMVTIERAEVGLFDLAAGQRRGTCRLSFWVPGNLGLEWPLTLEIGARERHGYQRSEAEFMAVRLYQGLLGRDPDPSGLAETAAAIQRGDLAKRIDSIVRSQEFGNKVNRTTPASILERLYGGLLGRAPDTSGVRAFLPLIERGRTLDVALELIRSEEFEAMLAKSRGAD